jgi:hypothetical protein
MQLGAGWRFRPRARGRRALLRYMRSALPPRRRARVLFDAHAADRQQHFELLLGLFGRGRFKRDCVGGKARYEKQRANELCLRESGSDRTATYALRKVRGALALQHDAILVE